MNTTIYHFTAWLGQYCDSKRVVFRQVDVEAAKEIGATMLDVNANDPRYRFAIIDDKFIAEYGDPR